jgi:BirA family biotin operon repressor/biotin-[acetyl-CoA-carboxylase] ligase
MMINADAPVALFDEIDSTNSEAQRRADAGEAGPIWLRAHAQTAGRGRRGRRWVSERGNLFVTYYAHFAAPPGELARLSFAAALAVADLAQSAGAGPISLKWPNDVLIDGAKCAGILLESGAAGSRLEDLGRTWLALGIGINLTSAPDDAAYPVAALHGLAPDVAFDRLRQRLAFWSGRLAGEGFAPLRDAWLARAHGLGHRIRVDSGGAPVEGVFMGLSEGGELQVSTDDGREALISAGEVFFSTSDARS